MYKWRNLNNERHEIYSYFIMETIQKSKLLIYFCWIWELLTECYVYPYGVATRKLLVSPKYFINTSKSTKKIRFVTCHYTPVAKYQSSSKPRVVEKSSDIWLRLMNMDNVICIGYFVAGYQKNNNVFLHWQHREKCTEDQ